MRFKMFRKAIIGISLCAMLGGSFAASLPRVNIAVNAQAQSIKPTENTITYNYNGDTPLKLTGYSNSVAAYNEGVSNLQYNAQNEIIRDDHGNALDYDALGAMIEFTNVQSSVEVQYQYDAESHQSVESTFNNKGEVQTRESFYYSTGDKAEMLAESDRDGNQLSYLFAEEKIGSINNSDEANLYITDQAGSVVALVSNSQLSHEYVYSPYGIETDLDQSTTKAKNAQGFDGERTDKATGYQFLGNGYRAYNPILHRFMQMDDISYSPFGKGGINGYVFGNNNPVMNFDPSGHWSVPSWLNYLFNGIGVVGAIMATFATGGVLGVPLISAIAGGISASLGITAQALVDSGVISGNSQIATGLNNASMALGIVSTILDSASMALNSYYDFRNLNSSNLMNNVIEEDIGFGRAGIDVPINRKFMYQCEVTWGRLEGTTYESLTLFRMPTSRVTVELGVHPEILERVFTNEAYFGTINQIEAGLPMWKSNQLFISGKNVIKNNYPLRSSDGIVLHEKMRGRIKSFYYALFHFMHQKGSPIPHEGIMVKIAEYM